jgi:hypothetical protein
MATRTGKRAAKPVKKAVVKKTIAKKSARKNNPPKKAKPSVFRVDLSAFPLESVVSSERSLCVACVWQLFTHAMSLAPKTALAEMKRYTPSFEELTSAEPMRPFFAAQDDKQPCPYCGAPAKWHARIASHRIESGEATDTLRRSLVKSLPASGDQFVVLEQKATQQHAFFEWLEKISVNLDLNDPAWLRDISLHYLGRKEPKVNWQAEFAGVHSIRRSRRLAPEQDAPLKPWEVEHGRLYLSPMLFDELLLVQYLVSRSQLAGGLTLERRYTLPELWQRLRHSGYLRSIGVQANNPSDALEQMLAHLSGGEASARYYYIVDRREHLKKVKALQKEKPRARAAGR